MKNNYVPKKTLIAKKHEQALIKRIAIISVFCIAGILLVIYYAIPAMVKIADVWDTTKNANVPSNSNNGIDIPLRKPDFNALPFDATNSATLTISGRAEPGHNVHLIFNGSEREPVVADNSGIFTFANISMTEGTNSFSGYSQDNKGRKSSNTNVYTVTLDTRFPKIELSSPNNGETFGGAAQSIIEIKGKADEASEMYVNGSRIILNLDGSFSQKVPLQSGENTITVYAMDEAGNKSVEVTRKVIFNP